MEIGKSGIENLTGRLNPLMRQAHRLGKRAVVDMRDALDSQFHIERSRRHQANQAIDEAMEMLEVAKENQDEAEVIMQTEGLCRMLGNELYRADEINDEKRIKWSIDNLIPYYGQLSDAHTDHLFKPEQQDVIEKYVHDPIII